MGWQDLLEPIAMSTIRSFLNNSIKKFNTDDLELAIKENKNLWSVTPESLIRTGTFLKARFGNLLPRYYNKITTDLLLNEWLVRDRPEFCNKIKTTPGGYQWFDSQVTQMKKQIFDI
jgi:hypothetical protein